MKLKKIEQNLTIFDVINKKPRPRGRPKSDNPKEVHLTFRLTHGEWDRVLKKFGGVSAFISAAVKKLI